MHRSLRCLFALAALLVAPALAGAEVKWESAAPFPSPSEELLGATAGGKMYLFAGLAPGFVPRGWVYEYDAASDKWTQKNPMPVPVHHAMFTAYNGKIYGFGGFSGIHKAGDNPSAPFAWLPMSNAWEYTPATDTWKPLAPMPTKRGGGAAAVVNGKIYVIGGFTLDNPADVAITVVPANTPHHNVGTVEEYDPATNRWKTMAAMPTPRNHFLLAPVNNKLYAIGGRMGAGFISNMYVTTNTGVVEEFDPATNSWNMQHAHMLTPRSSLSGGAYNGKIVVAGGELQTPEMSSTYRAVESYDPVTNRWSVLPPMQVSRHGMAGAIIGNKLHLVTGDVQSALTGLNVSSPRHDVLVLE